MARLAKYTESVVVVDSTTSTLVAAEGATVDVYVPDDVTHIDIYSDADGTLAESNPLTLGADGLLEFYVRSQDRRFDLKFTSGGGAYPDFTTFTLEDCAAVFDDKTYYASEYASLQAAVTAMTAGSTLIVDQDFTLSEALSVNKNQVVIEGLNRGIAIDLSGSKDCDVIDLQGNQLTLRNLTIDGNADNQGSGQWYGIDCSGGLSDCLIEDVYVHNVRGDGIRVTNVQDTTFRRVRCHDNEGYGFSHDASTTSAARVTFDDCQATENGDDPGMSRLDGFRFEPPFDDCTLDKCLAKSNAKHGISFVGDSTSATKKRISLDSCHSISNGSASNGCGLYVDSDSNGGTVISELTVSGGHYSDNAQHGIYLVGAEVATDPGTDSIIRNFKIAGPTVARNYYTGIYIRGRVGHGTIISPILNNNGLTSAPFGEIQISSVDLTNQLADDSDEKRAKWINIISPHIWSDSDSSAAYGIGLQEGSKYCVVIDPTIVDAGVSYTGLIYNAGKGNIIRSTEVASSAGYGIGGGGGLPTYELTTDSDYGGNPVGTFWVTGRTNTISTTETRVGSNRFTANTRILALVPLDITAANQLICGNWYQDTSSSTSGSATGAATAGMGYVTIKTQVAASSYTTTGEFAIFCAEAQV